MTSEQKTLIISTLIDFMDNEHFWSFVKVLESLLELETESDKYIFETLVSRYWRGALPKDNLKEALTVCWDNPEYIGWLMARTAKRLRGEGF